MANQLSTWKYMHLYLYNAKEWICQLHSPIAIINIMFRKHVVSAAAETFTIVRPTIGPGCTRQADITGYCALRSIFKTLYKEDSRYFWKMRISPDISVPKSGNSDRAANVICLANFQCKSQSRWVVSNVARSKWNFHRYFKSLNRNTRGHRYYVIVMYVIYNF